MTVIRPNSISGINSITAQSGTVEFYDPSGNKATVNSENLNVVGVITAAQLNVGTGITITAGVITATSFSGDGSNLSGIDATSLKDSGGNVIAQAEASGLVITGITTVTSGKLMVGNAYVSADSIGIGSTTTSGRDAGIGTMVGSMIYNSTTNAIESFGPEGWRTISSLVDTGITATGGLTNDYQSGGKYYRSHTFNSSGNFTVTSLGEGSAIPSNIDYLVVGGGGSGGNRIGGGGGGGGFRTASKTDTSVSSYPIVIGAGAAGPNAANFYRGNTGNNTTAFSLTSNGGGGGGGNSAGSSGEGPGAPGASGGGGGCSSAAGYPGGTGNNPPTSPPQGNNGGTGTAAGGAGGGGAGAVGSNAPGSTAGAGGAGAPNVYRFGPSNPVTYAGGGGGGGFNSGDGNGGAGGAGGGGNGTFTDGSSGAVITYAIPGQANTGGGGGGESGADPAGFLRNPNGGSGVVVLRYEIGASQTSTAKATGGNVSFYNGKTIHIFQSSGTFTTTSNWTSSTVEYVMIGGGGAGGDRTWRGGGGGAGAYKTGTFTIGSHPIATTITIGGGGYSKGAPAYTPAGNGSDSSLSNPGTTITSAGGGQGGAYPDISATSGGSGGGAGGGPSAPGSNGGTGSGDPFPGSIGATPSNGWGHDGGATATNTDQGAGGGGAGATGSPNSPSVPTRGFGGSGVLIPTTFRNPANVVGDSRGNWYVGGGGNGGGYPSGVNPAVKTTVPLGGGGVGGITGPPMEGGYPAEVNTGSGGGGASGTPDNNRAGSGGSGLVIIAYPT